VAQTKKENTKRKDRDQSNHLQPKLLLPLPVVFTKNRAQSRRKAKARQKRLKRLKRQKRLQSTRRKLL
jgi:hypothetical protein